MQTPLVLQHRVPDHVPVVFLFFNLVFYVCHCLCPVVPYLSSYLRSNLKTNINLTLKQLAGVAHDVIFRLLDN